MVDAVVAFSIKKLSDFLGQEVNTRRGVKDGIRWLKDELVYLESWVRYAETEQELDNHIRRWIHNVRDVANEAVLILDRFSVLQEEYAAPKRGFLHQLSSWWKKEANLSHMGKEIKLLKGRIIEIKKKLDEYSITNISANPKVRKRTLLRATSFQNQVAVVGFQDDVQTLLAQLVSGDPSLCMISIHGMGGLGKTTLASKLYHSSQLSHFNSRAWVCVSQEYNIKDVLKKIIKSFMRYQLGHELDLLNKMDQVDLLQHLRKLLLDRDNYLAVIDDLWDIETWERIKKAFPDKKNGSRIIITTRNKNVAERVDDRCFVYQLNFLGKDESWQLFCKRVKPTQNLEKLGKEMVGKCRGLPLAIVVLSGLLLHKKSYEDWSKVKENIWRRLKGDSVEIQEILSLSFNDLPFQMKQCFLYLARYPEDHTFDVQNLKLLWIAEEFVSEDNEADGVVMEDVAEDILNELINRNMIQIATLLWEGHVLDCRVHDLVRELAIQKATEDKLLGVFDSSRQYTSLSRMLHGQPRHAIHNGIGKYLKSLGLISDNLKLRSLALISESRLVELEEIRLMYTKFKYLKVLDLTRVRSRGIPEEIGDLVLLKFLGFTGNIFRRTLVIPTTIGKLKRLQTLCGSFLCAYQFPREVCELKELRHLSFRDSYHRGSLKIGRHQTKLQTLDSIWLEDWIKINTVKFTNLHTLSITDESIEENGYTLDSIVNLKSLQTFSLFIHFIVIPTIKPLWSCKCLKSVLLNGRMKDPSDLSFLPDSVTHLTLGGNRFTQDPMPTLGTLSSLTSLELNNDMYLGNKMECSPNSFPSLKFFKIKNHSYLEEWQVEDGALASLKGFDIENCKKLKMLPQLVRCIPPIPVLYL